jgi:hypothetical protein
VKNWSQYDPVSEDAIMSLANWAQAFSGPLFRKRLEPDYLAQINTYVGALLGALQQMGKTGSFWQAG